MPLRDQAAGQAVAGIVAMALGTRPPMLDITESVAFARVANQVRRALSAAGGID